MLKTRVRQAILPWSNACWIRVLKTEKISNNKGQTLSPLWNTYNWSKWPPLGITVSRTLQPDLLNTHWFQACFPVRKHGYLTLDINRKSLNNMASIHHSPHIGTTLIIFFTAHPIWRSFTTSFVLLWCCYTHPHHHPQSPVAVCIRLAVTRQCDINNFVLRLAPPP